MPAHKEQVQKKATNAASYQAAKLKCWWRRIGSKLVPGTWNEGLKNDDIL